MNSMIAYALGLLASSTLGLSLMRVQQQDQSQYLQDQRAAAAAAAGEKINTTLDFTEQEFEEIAGLPDDTIMGQFIMAVFAQDDKFIPQDRFDEFLGFVHWFRGSMMPVSFKSMRQAISGKSFVKDLKTLDGASLTEADYQAVAAFHNDTAMEMFATAVLKAENRFVPKEEEPTFESFVQWCSGTQAIKTLSGMRKELLEQPWLRKMGNAVVGALPYKNKEEKSNAAKIGREQTSASEKPQHDRKGSGIANRKRSKDALARNTYRIHPKARAHAKTTKHQTVIGRDKANSSAAQVGHQEGNAIPNVTNHQRAIAREEANASAGNTANRVTTGSATLTNHQKAIARLETNGSAAQTGFGEANSTEELMENPWVVQKLEDAVDSILPRGQKKANASVAKDDNQEVNASATATNHQKAISREEADASAAKTGQEEVNAIANLTNHQKAVVREEAKTSAVKTGRDEANSIEELLATPGVVQKLEDVAVDVFSRGQKKANASAAQSEHDEVNASTALTNHQKAIAREEADASAAKSGQEEVNEMANLTKHQKAVARKETNASAAQTGQDESSSSEELLESPWVVQQLEDAVVGILPHGENIENEEVNASTALTNHQKAIARKEANERSAGRQHEGADAGEDLTKHQEAIAREETHEIAASAAKLEQEEADESSELFKQPWVPRLLPELEYDFGDDVSDRHPERSMSAASAEGENASLTSALSNHRKAIAREEANASAARSEEGKAEADTNLTNHQKAVARLETNGSAAQTGFGEANSTEELMENPWVAQKLEDVVDSILPRGQKKVNASVAKDDNQEVNASNALTNHQKVIAREEADASAAKTGQEVNAIANLTNHQKAVSREQANASALKTGRDEANSTEELLATHGPVQQLEDVVLDVFSHGQKMANASAAQSEHDEGKATSALTNHQKAIAREEADASAAQTSQDEVNAIANVTNHQKVVAREQAIAGVANITHTSLDEIVQGGSHQRAKVTAQMTTDKSLSTVDQESSSSASKSSHERVKHAEVRVQQETVEAEMDDVPGSTCLSCIVWGEAEILSFNAYHRRSLAHPVKSVELYARQHTSDQHLVSAEGTYWLVKNWNVQIQGRYWQYNQTKLGLGLGALALSGRALGQNVLIIRSRSGPVMWNDQAILRRINSTFSNEFVSATYVHPVGLLAGDTRAQGIKFEFANGMKLAVARYRTKLSAHISLCDYHVGAAPMEGQCGDFQKRPGATQVVLDMQKAARRIQASENLFPW